MDEEFEFDKFSKHELYMLVKYWQTKAEVYQEILDRLLKEKGAHGPEQT
jgi:hypothetical protein